LPESALPEPSRDHRQGPPASPALIALLKVLLAAQAEEHHVAPRLIASSEELERLATENEPQVPALHGWRRQVFGQAALALKGGRLALGVEGRKVKLIQS